MVHNPNNCATCKHKQHPDGGWCYMFKTEPQEVCMQHTARRNHVMDNAIEIIRNPKKYIPS